jgi:hypothetical protein
LDTAVLWSDTTAVGSAGATGATGAIGDTGPQGAQGVGVGVAAGGTVGQVLAKNSASDYDTEWASVGSAARPLLTGGAYLSGSGLVLGGVAANSASTPDSAALSVTGDIDIAVRVGLNSWTSPPVSAYLLDKYIVSSQRSYQLFVGTNGLLRLNWSDNGTNVYSSTSSVVTGITDGASKWIRVTLDVDDGAGNSATNFYTADDSATYPTSWTQLGATITRAGTTNIFNSTNALTVGPPSGTSGSSGTFYRSIVKDGIGGTTVFDADFATQTAEALAFTESSANAATVTINTTRYSYGIPELQAANVTTQGYTADIDFYFPFRITQPLVVDMFGFEVTTGPASASTTYMAIYNADDDLQPTGSPVATASEPVAASTAGVGIHRVQITPVTLPAGSYLIALNNAVSTTYRTIRGGPSFFSDVMGSTPLLVSLNVGRSSASFTASPSSWTTSTKGLGGALNSVHLRYKAAT